MEAGQDTGQSDRTGQDQVPDGTTRRDRTVAVAEAAGLLGLTTEAVRKRLQRGQLTGVKIGGTWLVQLDRTSETESGPTHAGQDRTTGQRARPVQREAPATRQLIEQLRGENDFLKEELRRKDMLLMAFAQGIQRIEGPKAVHYQSGTEGTPNQPQGDTEPPTKRRRWWSWLAWG